MRNPTPPTPTRACTRQFVHTQIERCAAIKTCAVDEEETEAPTMTSNRACKTCDFPRGFKDKATGKCKATTVCGKGEYVATDATKTSNRVCKAATKCTAEQFEETAAVAGKTDRVCADCTVCPRDHHVTAACTRREPFDFTTVGVNSLPSAHLRVRPMGVHCTCR